MILDHLNDLHAASPPNLQSLIKYGKLLVTACQHRKPHGEEAALLDFHPWKDLDDDVLIAEYVSTAPNRKKKKQQRKACPINASILFNKGGPEITGSVNMKIIADYEAKKVKAAAEKVAKTKERIEKKVQTREGAMDDVVNMVLQQALLEKNPPVLFYNKDHTAVKKKFKPTFQACKCFMQVTQMLTLFYIHIHHDFKHHLHLIHP